MYTDINMAGKPKRPDREYSGWGGKREGAGRLPRREAPTAPVFARLTELEIAALRAAGNGNPSEGVRRIILGDAVAGAVGGDASRPAGKRVVKFLLCFEDIEQVRTLGRGNASAGIRALVRRDQPASTNH